jgi:hypothetical protein
MASRCHFSALLRAAAFQAIIRNASFESCRPSQPVWSPPPNMRRRLKTTRYRGISRIPLGLRVGNWATEAPFRPPVSEATFLVSRFCRTTPTHTNKRGARYRYYVSHALLQKRNDEAGSLPRCRHKHNVEVVVAVHREPMWRQELGWTEVQRPSPAWQVCLT